MTESVAAPELQLADAARIMREAMRGKTYQHATGLGPSIAEYMRARSKSLAENSQDAYESTLHALAMWFPEWTLADYEPPHGTTRLEEFMGAKWGDGAASSYNRHLATFKDFFKFHVVRGNMQADPTLVIEKAKKQEAHRSVFTADDVRRILAENELLRDRIGLRLMLHYGLRIGGVRAVQFKHFDHQRKRLSVFLKGGKVRPMPIPEPEFWHDLERHILDSQAEPNHYLLTARWKNRYAETPRPDEPMSRTGVFKWWYRCLANAGITAEGQTSGEKPHKARHTAGQMMLDSTGNLVAVQKLLMHANITTTAQTYVDHDIDALTASLEKLYLASPDSLDS